MRVKNRKKLFISYSIFSALIFVSIYFEFIINGKTLIFGNGDAFHQHYLIFCDFHRILRETILKHNFSEAVYNWYIGLGADTLGQYGYYITGDIFAYLSLPFSEKYLPYVYSGIILLRIYCTGLSFAFFMRWRNKKNSITLLGSILYMCSAYIMYASIVHPYFTNAAIIFPIFITAIEKCIKEKRSALLTICFGITFLSNFYFAYKIIILGFVYACIYYYHHVKYVKNEATKEVLTTFFNALRSGVAGMMMAALLLFPTLNSFFNVIRVGNNNIKIDYDKNYYLNLLKNLVVYKEVHWAIVGGSTFGIIALMIIFMKWREYKLHITFLVVLGCILVLPQLGSLMNGFSYPTNRWSFIFCFWMTYIMTEAVEKIQALSKIEYVLLGIGVCVYSIFLLINFKDQSGKIVLILWGIFFLVGLCLKQKTNMQLKKLLLGCAIVSSCVFSVRQMLYHGNNPMYRYFLSEEEMYSRYNNMDGLLDGLDKAIRLIKEDESFYRVATSKKNVQNISLLLEYRGISTYMSLVDGNLSQWSYDLDNLEYTTSKPTGDFNGRAKVLNILGVKYYITEGSGAVVPYGFEMYSQIDDLYIYKNKYQNGLVAFYNDLYSKSMFEKLDGLDRENLLLEGAVIDESLTKEVSQEYIEEKQQLHYSVSEMSELQIVDQKIEVKEPKQQLVLDIEGDGEKELYLELFDLKCNETLGSKAFSVEVESEGKKVIKSIEDREKSQYYYEFESLLFNLGYDDKERKQIKIMFTTPGIYDVSDIKVWEVSYADFSEDLKRLYTPIIKTSIEGNVIKVQCEVEEEGIIQVATAYSKGWKASIKEKNMEVLEVNNGLLGVVVPKGKYQLVLEYGNPYGNIGVVCTILGWIWFAFICKSERKYAKR